MEQIIYTMRMAQHLIDLGFKPLKTVPNARDLSKNAWVFDDAQPGFKEAFAAYIAQGKPTPTPAPTRRLETVSDGELADLYFVADQPVEAIARVHGVTTERVLNAIRNDKRVLTAFGFAVMTRAEREAVMQLPQAEREAALLAKVKTSSFKILHGGAEHRVNGGEVE